MKLSIALLTFLATLGVASPIVELENGCVGYLDICDNYRPCCEAYICTVSSCVPSVIECIIYLWHANMPVGRIRGKKMVMGCAIDNIKLFPTSL